MMLSILLVTLVLVLSISWIIFMKQRANLNLPGPIPVPVLGNAHLLCVKNTEFLNVLHRLILKYGNIFHFNLLSYSYIVLSHPNYIEPVLSSSEIIKKGRSYDYLINWLGQGLLTASGQRWKNHRKFLTPAFHFQILQNFLPIFCKNQKILIEKLHKLADGSIHDMFPIIALAALDNVTESVMGVSVNAQKHSKSEYVKSIEVLSSILSMRMQLPFINPIFNLLPYKKKQDHALKVLHNASMNVIEARRADLKKENITSLYDNNDLGIKNKHAFLDLLLLAKVDGKPIDDISVREEVDTFMFEGHDTTTSGIVFTMFCLSKRRDVQDKIFEEQKSIFGENMNRDPMYNELHQMKYLEMVIRESMRLYPPVPLIERMVTKDCEVGELKLLKGTSLAINIYHSQRHPDVFEDALEFRPERFETPLKNPFNWLAFSAGPRNCIGQKFAMMELKVTIASIIKKFILLPSHIEPLLLSNLILRSQNGVNVKLIPRNQN